jgi:hypothetical protein
VQKAPANRISQGNNYAKYTTPMNKVLATDIASGNLSASELTIWFDEEDEKVKT